VRMFRYLIRPAKGGAAAVVVVFAVGLTLSAKAGFAGIPLAFILLSWFFKYAYVLFDHTVQGFDEPPTLDIKAMNPIDEQRPLAQLIILGLLFGLMMWVEKKTGTVAEIALGVAAVLLLPASVAILGLEGNILRAANPLVLWRLVRELGSMYALVLAIFASYVIGMVLLSRLDWWLPEELALSLFAILSAFCLLAGALYERRHKLGLETWHSPERKAERARTQEHRDDQRSVDVAYAKVRAGAHTEAWNLLQTWLVSRGHTPEAYEWLCERVAGWSDSRYGVRLTDEYLDRLLKLRRNGELLQVVEQRLRLDPNFRPTSASTTLRIAEIALQGAVVRVARVLLGDFATRYIGDAQVSVAARLLQSLRP